MRKMWRVEVDGCPMAHGPFDETDPRHPERMAETYRQINPTATVTVVFNDEDGNWPEDVEDEDEDNDPDPPTWEQMMWWKHAPVERPGLEAWGINK